MSYNVKVIREYFSNVSDQIISKKVEYLRDNMNQIKVFSTYNRAVYETTILRAYMDIYDPAEIGYIRFYIVKVEQENHYEN